MAGIGIESNGRIEKTAVYYNGECLKGIKELFINLDEEGTYDGIIQYEGIDKNIHTKNIFSDYMTNLQIADPPFTEEEALNLQLVEIESGGEIESTMVYQNEEPLEGIVSLFIHIKGTENKNSLRNLFSSRKNIPDEVQFKAQITFRNEDGSIETEDIF